MVSAEDPRQGSYLEPSRKPLNLLIRKMNGDVAVKLKNDTEYRGKMIDCDSHMNIILDGAREYRGGDPPTNYRSLIVRGSKVPYICVTPPSGAQLVLLLLLTTSDGAYH